MSLFAEDMTMKFQTEIPNNLQYTKTNKQQNPFRISGFSKFAKKVNVYFKYPISIY